MLYFLYLVAFLWLVMSFSLLAIPELMRKMYLRKIGNIKQVKLLSVIPLSVGALFFLSTSHLLVETFGYAMGMLALFKGLTLLFVRKERITQIMNWWVEAPSECLRMFGLSLFALTLVLLSLIR